MIGSSILLMLLVGDALGDGKDSEKHQIVSLLESYEAFVNESDAQGLRGLYAEDAILFPDRMDACRGGDEILGFYQNAFRLLSLDLEFVISLDEIVMENAMAYATTTSTGTRFLKEEGATVPEINRELWVFVKGKGEWKISRYCFNQAE